MLLDQWRNRLARVICQKSATNYHPDAPVIGSNGEPFWKEFLPEANAAILESLKVLQEIDVPRNILERAYAASMIHAPDDCTRAAVAFQRVLAGLESAAAGEQTSILSS